MTNQKPNIVVIQADQMTPFTSSTYGHQIVKTPHLDQLAENGVVFDNAYCNFPLCVPSRMSMLAGRYANAIEVWDNATELPAGVPTLAHYLRSVNYETTLCGKMHFIGPDQVHGFNERITTDIYPSNFTWTPDWIVGERYRPTGISMRAVTDSGICVRGLQLDYDEEVVHAGTQKLYDLVRYKDDNPFLLWLSFTHPHSPYITTQEYWDLYDHDDIDMPAVDPIPLDDMDEMSRWLHYAHGGDLQTVTDEHVRTARHAYYGMCSYIDDKLGHFMKVLNHTGLIDNTVVIFIADHGEMLGERGMWYKQSFYEWSSRVPIVVSYPKTFSASRVSELVSLADLLPTLMDFATDGNVPDPVSPLDGHSLVPLMSGNKDDWDNTVISEYTGEGVNQPCRMVRRDNFKYIYTHGFPSLLYDLDSDPLELTNLAGDPEYQKIESELHATLLDGWDPDLIYDKCIQSQKERMFIQSTTDGEPSWAFNFAYDDENRFIRNSSAVDTKAKARYPFVTPTPFKE